MAAAQGKKMVVIQFEDVETVVKEGTLSPYEIYKKAAEKLGYEFRESVNEIDKVLGTVTVRWYKQQ
jgi:hypothetical protein